MIRAVLDTNVVASGFATPAGAPGQLMAAWLYGGFELVISEHILDELARVFETHYFKQSFGESQAEANLALLRRQAEIAQMSSEPERAASHPEDDFILETAVAGEAEYLVTGDRQLQALGTYQGITILSPRAFLEILTTSTTDDDPAEAT